MIILQVNNLSKSFGATEILHNIKLEIKHNDRIAIVGRNGSGKSTLLKIIAGELSYDEGEIIKPKDITIGYLSQHTGLTSNKTIWNEMKNVFKPLIDLQQSIRNLEQEMQKSEKVDDELLNQYDRMLVDFQTMGGYEYEANIRAVLSGLDFPEEDYEKRIQSLSGGQKTRLALGKLLLENPDLLILDEPTNHLDIATLSWLESYLKNYRGAILIVSHDRYFLEQTVSIIYEISHKRMKRYVGGYEKYLEQREKDYENQLKMYELQQEEIRRTEEFIERNIARASTSKRAKSRRKQLERLELIEKPLGEQGTSKFSFTINRTSGNDVLHVKEASFSYEDGEKLFQDVTFSITKGERVALIGPNGVGKTTLLKLIKKTLPLNEGSIIYGTNVQVGYYEQEQESLNESNTVLEELWSAYPDVLEQEIRSVLGSFLFSGDDVLKLVSSLSGGERARLSLAKLMMKQANFLILDEPTNHLDIASKEVLEAALIDYPGTIIFVSHDRYFINKIASRVLELNKDGVTTYLGDYDYYVMKKEEELERQQLKQAQEQKEVVIDEKDRKLTYEERKQKQREERRKKREIKQIEHEIVELEEKLEAIEMEMTKPEVYEDYEKTFELSEQADLLKEQLNELLERWEQLHE